MLYGSSVRTFQLSHYVYPLYTVKKETINYSTGSASLVGVDLDAAMAINEFQYAPKRFTFNKIDRAIMTSKAYKPEEAPQLYEQESLAWDNAFFLEGGNGWTVDSGSPEFLSRFCSIKFG